jgi:hypothetical protein
VTPAEREALIAAVSSAWRERGPSGGILPAPEWHDLDPAARAEAFEVTVVLRRLEAAAHPNGLSTTARAVLARIPRRRP